MAVDENVSADTPAVAPAVESKGPPAPPAPEGKAPVEDRPVRSSDSFDAIFEETQKELEEKENPTPEVKAEEDDDETPEAEKDEEDKPDDSDEKEEEKDEDSKDDDEDEAEGDKKPEAEAEEEVDAAEKTVAEQILELMKNPELLESALRQAGVETIQELPFVKDLVGRSTQSALDQAKAALAKEQFEAQQVTSVLENGRKAAAEVIDIIEKLQKDIDEGAEEFKIPESQFLIDKFNDYADGAVHAYHNKNFGEISETVYSYPEMSGLSTEQQEYLASFNGKPPAEWLDAHLQIQRQNLWNMAQNDVAQKAEQLVADRTKALEEAHKLDLTKLTEKHERTLAKSVEKAKSETRAEVLAEFATKGAPPRVPNKDANPVIDDDDIDTGDGSMEAIWQGVKRAQERSAGV